MRWSDSTEVGDFVQQAARVKRFSINLFPPRPEGKGATLEVVVPSFEERTRFLVARLRTVNAALKSLGGLKEKCDAEARSGARRMAAAGLGALVGYGAVVVRLTFWDLGWASLTHGSPPTYACAYHCL